MSDSSTGQVAATAADIYDQFFVPALFAEWAPRVCDAALIGEVTDDPHGFVRMQTGFGGSRVADWLSGEQLPRIC